jgi:phage shock protein C
MRSDSPFASPNPHRLYRNPATGKLFGVCAGLADYFGLDPLVIRAATVIGLIVFSMPVIIGYGLLALILPARPPSLFRSPAEEEFWRAVTTRPDVTAAAVRSKFRDLEKRLRNLETTVSSREFELSRAIRNLDR